MPEIDRLLTWDQLSKLVPYTRQHVARLEREGRFPQRYQIGVARVAWSLAEVSAWLATRRRGPLPTGPAAEAHPE